ncbi:type II secretion system F family protein (plasmid) [Rhizobium sp. TH2]|uniref:type II secretion system F family protein n=1 Tax=Rhizobium sp. TH2 TaxID=2775403 RepID=UPI0021581161|nr:type II secretion system F family protein [Rhizobium sp. TH2]UVC12612.1 type II secretion system F family protein [Rhizobium sp. TH2]
MTIFEYKALNASGKVLEGTIEAATPADVLSQLDNAGITPLSMRETSASGGRSWREWLAPEPGAEDITGFTVDLAMLLKGGVTLNEALVILTQMETRRWLVRLIRQLHTGLAGGNSLSKALLQHPKLFPPLYVKMVEVAEASGRLEPALNSIAQERRRSERLRKRLISAMAYPGFLAVAAVGVLIFVLLYIIPQFEGAIAGFRDKISPSALFVFRLSETFRANIDVIGGIVLGLLVALLIIKQFGKKRALWLSLLSRLPFTRQAVTYHITLTFCRTLQILLENGVDISTSLRLIRGISPLPDTMHKIDNVIAEVRGGKRLSQALARETLLPAHVVQMLRIGEEAGDLGASAGRVAGFYETKLDSQLGRLTAILGPALMMGVSLLIGWLILSIMSALMSINDLLV